MRWTVQRMPLATGGRRDRRRSRYTRDVIRVGTCTEDLLTIEVMKASREGNRGCGKSSWVAGGVEGGVGGISLEGGSAGSSHRMT